MNNLDKKVMQILEKNGLTIGISLIVTVFIPILIFMILQLNKELGKLDQIRFQKYQEMINTCNADPELYQCKLYFKNN